MIEVEDLLKDLYKIRGIGLPLIGDEIGTPLGNDEFAPLIFHRPVVKIQPLSSPR
jgi:hypothetical protein